MNNSEIIYAIESHHWDYEKEWIPSYIQTLEEGGIRAIKNPKVHNVFSNKVVEVNVKGDNFLSESWEKIKGFFNGSPFSLWLENSQSTLLSRYMAEDGFLNTEKYDGLAFKVENFQADSASCLVQLKDVESDEDIEKLVEVSSLIWEYPVEQREKLFNQRKSYITSPFRNGGYIIAYMNSKPVAYSNYRYSNDGRTLFMNGSGVLPEFRNQGIYSEMVKFRLGHAKSKGATLATCQARQGHSSPVLKKLGFEQYSLYDFWEKPPL
ncbi:GNAT family N-acetyltransferase [Bacillus sp. AK031]